MIDFVSTSGGGGQVRKHTATPPADHPVGLHAADTRPPRRDRRHRSFS